MTVLKFVQGEYLQKNIQYSKLHAELAQASQHVFIPV